MSYPEIKLFIGGAWETRPERLDIINPADEKVIGQVPCASIADLDRAAKSAAAAFEGWRRMKPAARARIMLQAASIMRGRIDEIATAVTLEQGKPLAETKAEVLRSCETIEWEAAEGRRLYGRVVPVNPDMDYTIVRQPIGAVAAFSPWNAPINSATRMVISALCAGCTVILKASEETPAGSMLMAKAFADAGLPAGVWNIVYGNPAQISEFLIPNPLVHMVTFTGSVPVGKRLAALAGQHMKPVVMELGGHAPVIVCGDIDGAVVGKKAATAKFRNAGQVCTSPTRFFVHENVFQPFLDAFVDKVRTLKVGNGMEAEVEMGPLTNGRRLEALQELVADAVAYGATLVCGGKRMKAPGYYYAPAVLVNVPANARIMNEEPFGPVAIINSFSALGDAIAVANSVPYGLAGYAFTDSARNQHELVEKLEVGNLSINHFVSSVPETPTGGLKDSGYGRAGGIEGQLSYTVVKNVSRALAD